MSTSHPWFTIQTRPKREWTARECLTSKGYECFLPSYRQRKRWADRFVERELPLFPSYLFCRFDLRATAAIGRVVSTPGVWRIVGFGGKPLAADDQEIEALQRAIDGRLPTEPWNRIPTGARVRVETGPLAGVEAITLPHSNNRKLVLSVSLLQRTVIVTLESGTTVKVLAMPCLTDGKPEPIPFSPTKGDASRCA
jgi:transcriptional antiterminator RfaH